MKRKVFGALLASALTGLISASAVAEEAAKTGKATSKPEEAKGKAAAASVGKCVHNCASYAECKGNGNNSCKGKNSCANEGLVPAACSSQKDADACGKVLDA